MAKHFVRINGEKVSLYGSEGVSVQELDLAAKSVLLQNFVDSIHDGYQVKNICILSVTTRPSQNGKEVLFLKIASTYTDLDGHEITRVAFLRGGAVFIIVTLKYEGIEHILTVKQSRFPAGGDLVELPAGMLDGSDDYVSMALKELKEELGMECNAHNLIDLNMVTSKAPRLYSTPGGSDEFAKYYLYDLGDLSVREFASFVDRKTGCANESEFITVNPMTWDNFLEVTGTTLSLAGESMYRRYKSLKGARINR